MNSTTELHIQSWLRGTRPSLHTMLSLMFSDAELFGQPMQWLASVIELMQQMGYNERAVRTAMFRCAAQGEIRIDRHGRRSLCMLATATSASLAAARRRLNTPPERGFGDDWSMLVNSGGIGAVRYAAARKRLFALDYCLLAPNILARPSFYDKLSREDGAAAAGHGLAAFEISGAQLAAAARQPLFGEAGHEADLAPATVLYREFVARFAPLRQALAAPRAISDQQAYQLRLIVSDAYRRCRRLDPLLPREWLPTDWPAMAAYQTYVALYSGCAAQAQRHLRQSIATPAYAPSAQPVHRVTHTDSVPSITSTPTVAPASVWA